MKTTPFMKLVIHYSENNNLPNDQKEYYDEKAYAMLHKIIELDHNNLEDLDFLGCDKTGVSLILNDEIILDNYQFDLGTPEFKGYTKVSAALKNFLRTINKFAEADFVSLNLVESKKESEYLKTLNMNEAEIDRLNTLNHQLSSKLSCAKYIYQGYISSTEYIESSSLKYANIGDEDLKLLKLDFERFFIHSYEDNVTKEMSEFIDYHIYYHAFFNKDFSINSETKEFIKDKIFNYLASFNKEKAHDQKEVINEDIDLEM